MGTRWPRGITAPYAAAAETRVFGSDHGDVGGYLLGLWGLPVPVVEAIALKQLGYHNRPIVFLNTENFYGPLLDFFEHQVRENFVKREYLKMFEVAQTPEEAIDIIARYAPRPVPDKYA